MSSSDGGAAGGGGGFGVPSASDAVRSARGATEDVQERFRTARKNPEKELGISIDELERRQREARKSRVYVSDETRRQFDVKSSARAQQIMNKGIDKFQREKRRKDLRKSLSTLRKVQVSLGVFGACFMGWLAITYLLPQYAAVRDRNRRMQLRYERAQRSLEELHPTDAAGETAGPPVGPVVRVFRVADDGSEVKTKRTIQ